MCIPFSKNTPPFPLLSSTATGSEGQANNVSLQTEIKKLPYFCEPKFS